MLCTASTDAADELLAVGARAVAKNDPSSAVAEIVAFLDGYARGTHGETPIKPSGLVRGGSLAPLIERAEYRRIVERYEADGTFMAPATVAEKPRLRAFHRYGLPASAFGSPTLERICKLAATLSGDPDIYAIINLIGEDEFTLVADSHGASEGRAGAGVRDELACSICTHAVLRAEVRQPRSPSLTGQSASLHLPATKDDWRFAANPWVTGEVVSFYSGFNIFVRCEPDQALMAPHEVVPTREPVGTLCLISSVPRLSATRLSPEQEASMVMLADLAAREIEALYAIGRRATEATLLQTGADLLKRRCGDPDHPPVRRTPSRGSASSQSIDEDFEASAQSAVKSLRAHLKCETAMVLTLSATSDDQQTMSASILHVEADDRSATFDPELITEAAVQVLKSHSDDHSSLFFDDAATTPGSLRRVNAC